MSDTPTDWSDDPRDPLPPEVCGICGKHWVRCACDPDDRGLHERIGLELTLEGWEVQAHGW